MRIKIDWGRYIFGIVIITAIVGFVGMVFFDMTWWFGLGAFVGSLITQLPESTKEFSWGEVEDI